MLEWWRRRQRRRRQLAQLEQDDTVSLATAMQLLDEETLKQRLINGKGSAQDIPDADDTAEHAVQILEDAIDARRS